MKIIVLGQCEGYCCFSKVKAIVLWAKWRFLCYKQDENYCTMCCQKTIRCYVHCESYGDISKVKVTVLWERWRLLFFGQCEGYGLWQGEGHCIMEGWLLLCYGQGEGYCIILKKWRIYCVMGRVKANVLWSRLRLCYGQGENSMTFYKSFILFWMYDFCRF